MVKSQDNINTDDNVDELQKEVSKQEIVYRLSVAQAIARFKGFREINAGNYDQLLDQARTEESSE